MKKILVCILIMAAQNGFAQQWGGSSNILGGVYRNGYVNIEGLYVSRYGSALSGDANPFTLYTAPEINEDHDLTIFGAGAQKLHFRLYDGDLKMGSDGTPNAILYNDGKAFFSGNVGLGISSPLKKLHLSGTSDVEELIETTNDGYASLSLKSNSKIWHWSKRPSFEQDALRLFYHNGTAWSAPYFTFSTNGNVGVGVENPTEKLQVGGNAYFDTNQLQFYSTGGGGKNFIQSISGKWTFKSNYDDIVFDAGVSAVGGNNYRTIFKSGEVETMRINNDGNVGIGTSSPDAKLAVKGHIHTQEVRVDLTGSVAPDYVFEPTYNLLPLSEVESYIKANKHLPEVPSAKQMEEEGLNLKEMNLLLLKKVEELTLHLIEQNKVISRQNDKIIALETKIN